MQPLYLGKFRGVGGWGEQKKSGLRRDWKWKRFPVCFPAAHCEVGGVASHVEDHVAGRQVQEVLLDASSIAAATDRLARGA